MEDPAEAGDESRQWAAFRQTVLYLSRRIDLLLALPIASLAEAAAGLRPPLDEPLVSGLVP